MNNPQSLLPSNPDQTVILVVDDEPIILNVVRIMLEKEGYLILHACDGEEALLVARRYPGTINLLLSDILMPRLDGYGLRERLLVERPAVRVLMMSGQVSEPRRGSRFLRKPFDRRTLKEAVLEALATRRSAAAN